MSAAMGAAGLGLAFTYYSSRHYFRNAEFLSLGAESAFIDLGIALPPGRYHSKAALAFKDTLKEVLQAADGSTLSYYKNKRYFSSRLQMASRCWY